MATYATSGSFVRANQSGRALVMAGVRDRLGENSGITSLLGINLGGPTGVTPDVAFGRSLMSGVLQSNTIGNPTAPSLQILQNGMWRFRWVIRPGVRSLYVNALQNVSASSLPYMVIKANPVVGLNNDISQSMAAPSTTWSTIGPLSFTATNTGSLWVELHANALNPMSSSYFDHIVVT